MQKLKPFLTFVFNKIFKSQFFIYWILATTIVLVIIFNVNVKFLSEGGKQAPDKGEFGDKGIVGELETIITSDNKYQGIEGDVSSENYCKLSSFECRRFEISILRKFGLLFSENPLIRLGR